MSSVWANILKTHSAARFVIVEAFTHLSDFSGSRLNNLEHICILQKNLNR